MAPSVSERLLLLDIALSVREAIAAGYCPWGQRGYCCWILPLGSDVPSQRSVDAVS